jgi:hypothetical protein
VAFRPEGRFLRIFDLAGHPVSFDHEQPDIRERLARRAEHAEQERAEAARRAELAEQEIVALRALIERLGGQAGEADG